MEGLGRILAALKRLARKPTGHARCYTTSAEERLRDGIEAQSPVGAYGVGRGVELDGLDGLELGFDMPPSRLPQALRYAGAKVIRTYE